MTMVRQNRNHPAAAKPLRLPAAAAGIASLILPGLGQALARQIQRGVLMLASTATILVMLGWRVTLLAHREVGAMAMLRKALHQQPLFIGLVIAATLILWLWNAWDAYLLARSLRAAPVQAVAPQSPAGTKPPGKGVFFYVLIIYFILGWQVSEINLVKMITQLPDAWPPLSKVLWPWEAAMTREVQRISAGAEIQTPCLGTPPAPPQEAPGKPYVSVEPRCGELSSLDKNNQVVQGTTVTLSGRGFAPNTETEIWWLDALRNEFRVRLEGKYLSVRTDGQGAFSISFPMPYRLIVRKEGESEIHRVEARQVSTVGPLKASEPLRLTIARMVETIFMGMMATVFGILFSIPISFLAARNLMSVSWITLAIYYATRTILNIIRSIEPLIWALIAVVWVGLGPFAGILALTIHSVAALGKLYSEAIENIDSGPIEAVQATGANRLQTIMYAVVPQMISPFVSFSIYRWDTNVRMSTVIGLVGGGGIGFILVQYIRLLDYRAAGIAVWFIAVTVGVLDYVSAEIRQRFS